jgi:hypothetical protein
MQTFNQRKRKLKMTTSIIVALINVLCPNLEAMDKRFVVQGEQVNCMEYYTNEIVNNPAKYEKMVKYVKAQ